MHMLIFDKRSTDRPGAINSIRASTPLRSLPGLHPLRGRTKECKGIDPGRYGRVNRKGTCGDPYATIRLQKKRGDHHLYSRQQVDPKYSLLVKSYPRGLWMSKKKTCEKARKTEKTLFY